MKKIALKRKQFWFYLSVLFLLMIVSATLWRSEPEEVTKAVSKEELIASNKSWIKTRPAIPLTNRAQIAQPVKNTKTFIENNGDMIFETTNPHVIKQIVKSQPTYSGMKSYRLRIFASKVAEYITNSKYKLPTGKEAAQGLTRYKIEKGKRLISSNTTPINIKHQNGEITTSTTLSITFDKSNVKKTAKLFSLGINTSENISFKDQFRATTPFVAAYPKVFAFKITLQKKTMAIFQTQKDIHIREPIGVEYVMK